MQFIGNHVHRNSIYLYVKIAVTSHHLNPQEVEEIVVNSNPGGQAIIPIPPSPAPTPPAPVSPGRAGPARPATLRVNHNTSLLVSFLTLLR